MATERNAWDRYWLIPAWIVGGLFALGLGLTAGFQIWAPGVVRQFEAVLAHTSNNTLIYDADDQLIATIEGVEDRHTVPISRISPYLQKAVVAIEDRRFFAHRGMDPVRLLGALWADLRAMSIEQGGSTITQQLVKLTLLSSERTLTRKSKEVFMAMALEQAFPKLKVLEFYLNRVYLGFGMYGVEKASQAYFHKSAADLDLSEAAFLAALIKKPEGFFSAPDVKASPGDPLLPVEQLQPLMQRQRLVIQTLRQLGWISDEVYQSSQANPLVVYRPRPDMINAPYFVQEVLKELRDDLGFQQISGRGYRVYTTLDLRQQQQAEALISHLRQRSSEAHQAALVALDPSTGYVRALVGGVDYNESQFNRATQALRQPGSAFKPILYATALEHGFSTNSVFLDEPVKYIWDKSGRYLRVYEGDVEMELQLAANQVGDTAEDADGDSVYDPRNYNDRYGAVRTRGASFPPGDRRMTLARALELSSNVVAVQLLDKLGMSALEREATRWDVPIRPEAGLCVALGCSEVTLINLTAAYGSFANGGLLVKPVYIRRVTNSEGDVVYEHYPDPPVEVISPWTAFQMRSLLAGVITRGTGVRANLRRPAGGKTGTNDGPRDTWFIGFTPHLVAGVWMGNDDNEVMGSETGGRTTAMLWHDFMQGVLPPYEGETFPEPPVDYVGVNICNVDGLPATPDCPVHSIHYFRTDSLPPELLAGSHASGEGGVSDVSAPPGTNQDQGPLSLPPIPDTSSPPEASPSGTDEAAPPDPPTKLPGFSFFARSGAPRKTTESQRN